MNTEGNETQEHEDSSLAVEFDSTAFMETDSMTQELEKEGVENEAEAATEAATETATETEEVSEDEATDWNFDSESEEATEDEEQSDVDAEGDEAASEETSKNVSEGWEDIAEAIGINADDYDTFIDTLKNQQELASKGATNDKIEGLNSLISLGDETLMRKELEARGFSSEEIEDEIDIMIENNTIRSEARKVRKDLERVVISEKNAIANQAQETDAMQQQEIEEATKELEEYMSKTNEMLGGRINSKQKTEHTEYISSGQFFDEVTETPQSMAEAAWLWRHKDQILKSMRTKGVEQGKAAILDKMVNPETTRKTNIPDPETGEFNPNRFMDNGEQM